MTTKRMFLCILLAGVLPGCASRPNSGGSLTASAYISIVVAKYSTRVSGGAATGLVAVRLDSATASATATNLSVYTGAPTAGNLLGPIAVNRSLFLVTATAAAANMQDAIFDFRPNGSENSGVFLRGTTEGVCANYGSAPTTTATIGLDVEWTEE